MLCSAMARPQQRHYNAAVRLARYLYLTKDMGLVYSADMTDPLRNKLVAYCDASWSSEAGSPKGTADVCRPELPNMPQLCN